MANAVCHRDYGSPYEILLKVYEDHLTIYSPGQLPFDMSIDLMKTDDHSSRPRNKIIAQAFFDMHVIEKYGSGWTRIKRHCDKNGNQYPTFEDGYGQFVVKYLPRKGEMDGATNGAIKSVDDTIISNPGLKRDDLDHGENDLDHNFDDLDRHLMIVIAKDGTMTYAKMAECCGVSVPTVQRHLTKLQKLSKITRVGPDHGGYWEVIK